ncbi:MAG: S9 family peptidase [Aureispira sp.]|nr:S9 family peptidase [Aureispira sp.]
MKRSLWLWSSILLFVLWSCDSNKSSTTHNTNEESMHENPENSTKINYLKDPNKVKIVYPKTKTVNVSDNYFGQNVKDPYRWLENTGGADSTAIEEWIDAQIKVSSNYLQGLEIRKTLYDRFMEVWNYAKYTAPFKEGKYYYYYKNDGLQSQAVVYQQESIDGKSKVFIDPNKFSKDGTVALSGLYFSKDGRYAALAVSSSGSDWKSVEIKDVQTNKMLEDKVDWLRYSGVTWFKDGFFYSRYADSDNANKYIQKNEFHQVYYHKLGTKQADDQLVFADRSRPEVGFWADITEDEKFLIVGAWHSTSGNALYYQSLDQPLGNIEPLIEEFDNDFQVIGNTGNTLIVYTNYNAPNYQIIGIDVTKPAKVNWKPIIKEQAQTLANVRILGGKLVCKYIRDVSHELLAFELDGKAIGKIDFPALVSKGIPVSIDGLSGKKSDDLAFYTLTSYTLPTTICKLDLKTLKSEVWKKPELKFNPEGFVVEQKFYKSKDGTKVPMSIVYKKGLDMNGKNPTILYGYGGFNISLMPSFVLRKLPFLEQGGVYAIANLRGGGEYGKNWHKAGTKLQKQNVFDDFIAAAERLIADKYTSSDKLAIEGGSNGGLLVGACMTQRPDLFRVAIPAVGVLDMLRYHQFTIGRAWSGDYGTSEDEVQFKNLIKYSPVHNVKKIAYPATLVMTADHDDRVVPAHSFKFISELQAKQAGPLPVLIRIDKKAGHGAGTPTKKRIASESDKLAFVLFNTSK